MRKPMSRRASRSKFRKTSANTRAINVAAKVMRGGYRL